MKKLLAAAMSFFLFLGTSANVYATSGIIITDEESNETLFDQDTQEEILIESLEIENDEENDPTETDTFSEEDDEEVIIIVEDEEASATDESTEEASSVDTDAAESESSVVSSADYTSFPNDEIKLTYRTFEGEDEFQSVLEGENLNGSFDSIANISFPSTYTTPDLPALRYQNPYGSCWAHSTMALAEINLVQQGIQVSPDLSELHLAYFSYNSVVDPLGGTNGDYNRLNSTDSFLDVGGNVGYALHVLATWQGVVDESAAPYSNATTYLSTGLPSSMAYEDDIHVTNYYKEKYLVDGEPNLNPIKELLVRTGAVSLSYKHSQATGVFNSDNNCYYNPGSASGGHAVTIVGWDDDFSRNNFTNKPSGDGAWLIRNSWYTPKYESKGIGEYSLYGYFWMSYYEPTISSEVYAAEFSTSDDYDNNYQYDGSMASNSLTMNKLANIFTVGADTDLEVLKAVSFSTLDSNTSYRIDIYTDLASATNPTSGTMAATIFKDTDYAGYYTVPLDEGIILDHGTKFSIVISSADSSSITLETERSGNSSNWYTSKAAITKGQSFYSSGKSWNDLTPTGFGNIRIKAFTDNINTFIVGDEPTPSPEPEAVPVTVTLDACGGTSSVSSMVFTGTYEDLPTPTYSYKEFEGWFTDPTEGTRVYDGSALISDEDHVLYAHWSPYRYEVNFDANGGSGSMDAMTCDYGTTYYLTANAFAAPEGYKFGSWNTKKDGSGTSYTNKKAVKNLSSASNGSVTLYAQWVVAKYTIKFSPVGGTISPSSLSTSFTYPELPTPTKAGYAFAGWYTASSAGTMVNAGDKLTTYAAHTIYAHWTPNQYTISFDANGGGGSKDSKTGNYGASISLGSCTFTAPAGYKFGSWNSQADGSGTKYTYTAKNLTTEADGNVTLYAQWIPASYTVTFNANGGTTPVSKASNTFVYPELPVPTRVGFTFDGWYSSKTDGTQIHEGDPFITYAAHSIYAHWIPNKYTIVFDANGGTGSMDAKECNYGTSYALAKATFTAPAGYRFNTWNTEKDGSGKSYPYTAKNLTTEANGTVTLYAQWTPASYVIYFNANGGTTPVTKLTASLVYPELPVPTRDGYEFDGWYSSKTGGTQVSEGDDFFKYAAHTVYAHWIKK